MKIGEISCNAGLLYMNEVVVIRWRMVSIEWEVWSS
jgi:hypothetical protein